MTDSPALDTAIPAFATLAADPEIAPLLRFDPVVRKVKRPDGWTPELQRELIARLAATGTLQAAVWQMGKHATGAEALYKVPGAAGFRLSWDAAIIIGRRRNHLDSAPPFAGPVPGISRRNSNSSPAGGGGPAQLVEGEPDEEISEEHKNELIERIGNKFLRKVIAERQTRLNGGLEPGIRQPRGLAVASLRYSTSMSPSFFAIVASSAYAASRASFEIFL